MQIVDSQLHGNRLGSNWQSVPFEVTMDRVVAGMDALGISAAVLDEYIAVDADGNVLPGSVHRDGHWRPKRPFSELAVSRHPNRFAYVSRMDRHDPALPRLMVDLVATPGLLGLRVHYGTGAVGTSGVCLRWLQHFLRGGRAKWDSAIYVRCASD